MTTKLPSYLSLETLLSVIVIYISHEISSHSAYLLQLAPSPHATQLPGPQGSPLSTLSFSYGRTLPTFPTLPGLREGQCPHYIQIRLNATTLERVLVTTCIKIA